MRDILSMGARPLAVMDQLRFGDVASRTPRGWCTVWSPGSVATATVWDFRTSAEKRCSTLLPDQPLVNALCVGAMRHEDIHVSSARGAGNLVVLYGALTGGDGIGGVRAGQ